jgi:hypothetical protein
VAEAPVILTSTDHPDPITLTAHQPGPTPLQLRVERAATELGQDVAEVERLPFDLSALDEDGIFVVRRATCG